jgi:hypothetical protein
MEIRLFESVHATKCKLCGERGEGRFQVGAADVIPLGGVVG